MKRTTIIFIILYLLLFSGVGAWFYYKYFPKSTKSATSTPSITLNKDKTILYTVDNNLYQLNADNLNRNSQDIATFRLQSTGQVQTVKVDQQNEFFIYDCLTANGASEIWQVSFKDNHSEKIFSSLTPGFEAYNNFRSPKMSPVNRQMAFLASSADIDDIFVWDIATNSIQNMTQRSIKAKITTFDWSASEAKIYFTTQENDKTSLLSIDSNKASLNLFTGINKITQMTVLKDKIIVLFLDSNLMANLGYINLLDPQKIIPISDLKTPSTLLNFDIAPNTKQIVYQAQNTLLKTNDLYIVNLDGTNLLQLTTDNKSFFPIFSPDSKKIAFYLKDSGIYTIDTLKSNKTKILNNEGKIDNLVLWR